MKTTASNLGLATRFYRRFVTSIFIYWLNGSALRNMRLLLKVRDSERAKYPQLVKLIIQSDDMDGNRERQYWLDRLEGFTAKQAQQLELELTESEKLIANVKQAFFATTIMTYPFLDGKDKTLSLYWNIRVIGTDYIARLRAAAKQMVDKERGSEVS